MIAVTPKDPADQLQWLVDRAAISDLLLVFARSIDDKDQDTYASTFTEDGAVHLPHASIEGRANILTMRRPPPNWGTHHISTNHQISIDGDNATARAYLAATHVFDAEAPDKHARAGGWYDVLLKRTAEGWRFKEVRLKIVWNTGKMV